VASKAKIIHHAGTTISSSNALLTNNRSTAHHMKEDNSQHELLVKGRLKVFIMHPHPLQNQAAQVWQDQVIWHQSYAAPLAESLPQEICGVCIISEPVTLQRLQRHNYAGMSTCHNGTYLSRRQHGRPALLDVAALFCASISHCHMLTKGSYCLPGQSQSLRSELRHPCSQAHRIPQNDIHPSRCSTACPSII
jgi:hypothetical protein